MSGRILANFAKEIKNYGNDDDVSEGEHRPLIYNLFVKLFPDIKVHNEPGLIECGAPDFIIKKNGNVVGHVEHKKTNIRIRNMRDRKNKEQQERYRMALPNLIYTNGLEWDFYQDGKTINDTPLRIDCANDRKEIAERLKVFVNRKPAPISDPETLAKTMAGKTTLLKIALQKKLKRTKEKGQIQRHYNLFKQNIMLNKTKDQFAELYAESITYGMFSARMNVPDEKKFTRSKARKNLSKNNPFLYELFQHIYRDDFDTDIKWIIDDLASLLSVCEVKKLMAKFMKVSGREDPFLHFFETFLQAYDPERRRESGVYYTPNQAVSFIVRTTDLILKEEFGIDDGLADISTIPGKNYDNGNSLHRVRVIDPATGTGTFLVEVVKHVAPIIKRRAKSSKAWTSYVEKHLIPRLHGFEILMAPYAMCFAKIDMVLKSLDYSPSENPSRFEVYLSDALNLGKEHPELLGLEWITDEVKLANLIKDGEKPVMCVIGNPPYNAKAPAPEKGSVMETLLSDYKKEPGTTRKLNERNSKQLNDWYLQFMRLSSHLIETNEEGIVGLITNNTYLKDPTFRAVRHHLLNTFDKIWIVNLHGDSSEKTPDGDYDINIFDITKGVSIIIGVKMKGLERNQNSMARVRYIDLWGTRESKLEWLKNSTILDSNFKTIEPWSPDFSLISIDNKNRGTYNAGFRLTEMMPQPEERSGIVTSKDKFALGLTRQKLEERLENFSSKNTEEARSYLKCFLKHPQRADDPIFFQALRDELSNINSNLFDKITYRPFDTRFIYYTGYDGGIIDRSRREAMSFMKIPENIAICVTRTFNGTEDYSNVFCCKGICDSTLVSSESSERLCIFPLMVKANGVKLDDGNRYNFDPDLLNKICKMAKFASSKRKARDAQPVDVFNYIYGVLHCPRYRSVYKQFFSLDFPRIPWPSSAKEFWSVSEKGEKLIKLHLMESETEGEASYPFVGEGDISVSGVGMPRFVKGKIKINSKQHFDNVPVDVWNFRIGSYRPAQDWLKKRKDVDFEFEWDDIVYFERILKVLSETQRIMKTIEMNLPDC